MVERIVLYADSNKFSPFTERVEMALLEAGAQYTTHTIDLSNKPAYYAEKINPAGKIPAIVYGGPDVPPDQPSPESAKIPESLVLLEFVADLFPSSGLLPSSPVERAKVRLFIDAVNAKLQTPLFGFLIRNESTEPLVAALESLQTLLPAGAKFAVGNQFTIADAALAPLLWRLEISLKHTIGGLKADGRVSLVEAYKGQRFEKLRTYFENIKSNKNFKAIQTEESIVEMFKARMAKAQQQ